MREGEKTFTATCLAISKRCYSLLFVAEPFIISNGGSVDIIHQPRKSRQIKDDNNNILSCSCCSGSQLKLFLALSLVLFGVCYATIATTLKNSSCFCCCCLRDSMRAKLLSSRELVLCFLSCLYAVVVSQNEQTLMMKFLIFTTSFIIEFNVFTE